MQTQSLQPPQLVADIQQLDQILERASLEQLEDYAKSIDEEKELRRLKEVKWARLKLEMKQERQKMINNLHKLHEKMTQNIDESETDDDEHVKRPVKKRRSKKD